jgi:hypothetical protein
LVFFPLATAGCIVVPLVNPDGSFARPILFAIISGLFFGGWTLLSVYMLVACCRERLYASGEAVRSVGVFRSKTILFAEVSRAVWRCWPRGGSVVLHTAEGRLAIGFANYEGGKELAAFIRAALQTELQTNYECYESTNVPASRVFQDRQRRDRRAAAVMQPVLGVALLALAFWDP